MAEAQMQQDTQAAPGVKTRSRRQDFVKAFFSNRLAILGTVVLAIFIIMAVFAPFIAPYGPLDQNLPEKFDGPSLAHPFGQDELGRDILSRVIYGARISLTAGLAAVAIATSAGTLIGVVSGYFGSYTDSALMRLRDVILAFPSILLAIVIESVLGPFLVNAMLAIGVFYLPLIARRVRSAGISFWEWDFIEA